MGCRQRPCLRIFVKSLTCHSNAHLLKPGWFFFFHFWFCSELLYIIEAITCFFFILILGEWTGNKKVTIGRKCILWTWHFCVGVVAWSGLVMNLPHALCSAHVRVHTNKQWRNKTGSVKESWGNKALCVIALGKGLPTISQFSNEPSLWIY